MLIHNLYLLSIIRQIFLQPNWSKLVGYWIYASFPMQYNEIEVQYNGSHAQSIKFECEYGNASATKVFMGHMTAHA